MEQTPSGMLYGYVRAFETLRPEEVVPFYELPCTFIRPDGTWVVQDEPTARVLVGHLIEHAMGQGYRRTDVCGLTTRPLATGLAELSGVFVRYGEARLAIGRFGFTYIVRRGSDGWRIVVAVAHDAETQASLLQPGARDRTGNERTGERDRTATRPPNEERWTGSLEPRGRY